MTDTSNEAVAFVVGSIDRRYDPITADLIEALADERDELQEAIDSTEIEHGLTSNGNLWRFWSKKSQEVLDTNKVLRKERDALKSSNAALIQEREGLIETKREQIHRMTGERNKARQEVFKLKEKVGVATNALSTISVRMELTGDEMQRVAFKALTAIKET